jgi:hypothetical protein
MGIVSQTLNIVGDISQGFNIIRSVSQSFSMKDNLSQSFNNMRTVSEFQYYGQCVSELYIIGSLSVNSKLTVQSSQSALCSLPQNRLCYCLYIIKVYIAMRGPE